MAVNGGECAEERGAWCMRLVADMVVVRKGLVAIGFRMGPRVAILCRRGCSEDAGRRVEDQSRANVPFWFHMASELGNK